MPGEQLASTPDHALPQAPFSYNAFLRYDARVRSRPMDHLMTAISASEAADLVQGCEAVVDVIKKEDPAIVFFPLRGAGPIEWTSSALIAEEGLKSPLFVDLPLGTHTNSSTKQKSGISGNQKLEVVSETLDRLKNSGLYIPGQTRLMIVDEVQKKGGTLTQATEALRRAMLDREDPQYLSIIAVQDSRHGQIGAAKTSGFRKLAANERHGLKTYVIPTQLFTVDQDRYLDVIVRDTSTQNDSFLDQVSVAPNLESRQIFRSLAQAYLRPNSALAEIEMIRREQVIQDLGKSILQYPVIDTITDPREITRPVSTKIMLDWWSRFLQHAIERQPATYQNTSE